MIIAAVSDSHDHRAPLAAALQKAIEEKAQVLFHLGDLISPFMLSVLKEFPGRIYLVIDNNDGDALTVSRTIPQECPQVREYSRNLAVDIDGVRIGGTHYPEYARSMAGSGNFDIVLYGHTHQYSEKVIGETLLLNPGDLMGLSEDKSFCLVDTETREARRLFV